MTLFQGQTEKLARRLASVLHELPDDPSPKYVHRLRTAIRRIESLVSYAQPDLGRKQKKALQEMAMLRKRAGKVRDVDVQVTLLKEIANRSTAGDRNGLGGYLQQKREKQARRLVSAARTVADSKFSTHLKRIVEEASVAAGSGSHQDAVSEAAKRLSEVEAEFTSHATHHAAQLHRVRIQIKKTRYLAELAGETPERTRLLERLKSVQDALGNWHDWQALAGTADKHFRQRVNCPLLVEIRALLAAKQATATSAVHQFFAHTSQSSPKRKSRSVAPQRALLRRAG